MSDAVGAGDTSPGGTDPPASASIGANDNADGDSSSILLGLAEMDWEPQEEDQEPSAVERIPGLNAYPPRSVTPPWMLSEVCLEAIQRTMRSAQPSPGIVGCGGGDITLMQGTNHILARTGPSPFAEDVFGRADVRDAFSHVFSRTDARDALSHFFSRTDVGDIFYGGAKVYDVCVCT